VVRNLVTGELVAYVAKATAIASGGAGRPLSRDDQRGYLRGHRHALALETGVAAVANMEAIQFHPTAIFPASILVTEGCRGRWRIAARCRRQALHARLRAGEERSCARAMSSHGAWKSTFERAPGALAFR
jgi:succinate dehydrogenase/fumarate reductase flavoprotein subunit